jgi:uncharacterized protein (DUF58 family)/predicted small secreted protein
MNMKKLISLCTLFFVSAFLLVGCEKPSTQNGVSSTDTSVVTGPKEVEEDAYSKAWPPVPKEGEYVNFVSETTKKNYLVVFDASGSMNDGACGAEGRKIDIAKTALTEFAAKVPDDVNLGLVVFDDKGVNVHLSLGSGPEHRLQFIERVKAVSADGGTPLKDATALGYRLLREQGKRQRGYGEYHLVVATDGEANFGQDPAGIIDATRPTPVMIHTIGFCIGEKHSLNRKGITLYQEATDLTSLRQGLEEVLAE